MPFRWRGGKVRLGVEYYNYPSLRAQRLWANVYSLGRSATPRGFICGQRGRDGYLLHFVRRGEMWHRIDGHAHLVGAGDVALMDLQRPAAYGNDRARAADNWWVLFNGKDVPAMFAELRADREPVFTGIDPREVESRFTKLLDVARRPPAGHEAESAAALLSLLALCFGQRSRAGEPVPLIGRAALLSDPVRKGIDYMTRFYNEPKTLKHVASVSGRSMSSFVRLFHEEVGMPPMRYLNRYRVEQAKRLLEHGDKSVAEIGELVGIPRANYFTRLFAKVVGQSATAYRRKSRRGGRRTSRDER